MTTENPKDKPDGRLTPMRDAPRTTDPVGVIGELNTIFSEWLAGIRRNAGSFVRRKSRRLPQSSDAGSRPATINEQIALLYQLERVDRACGVYPSRRRHGDIEPLAQLIGPTGKEVKGKD